MAGNTAQNADFIQALQWHIDHGADDLWLDEPVDRTAMPDIPKMVAQEKAKPAPIAPIQDNSAPAADMMGAAEAIVEAQKLATACKNLDELKQVIQDFEGLSVKKTATNMVFSDGNPEAKIMLIGEAPGADEDIQGKPFVGMSGQLLDKILACINLSRDSDDIGKSVYISNILNWRPPGNRTPTQAEMDISMAFIKRHIELTNPDMLILCGGVAAKTILQSSETISKLRGKFHDYPCGERIIPAMATYHPAYLLRTPAQKKAVWADMLMLQDKLS